MLAKGIMRGTAPTHQPLVPTHMSMPNAEATDMLLPIVTRTDASVDRWACRPHYARDLVWDEALMHHMTLMQFTEIAPPLLSPPDDELNKQVALGTIACNPLLFKLVMPINVNLFEFCLTTHPNQPFISSVCCGFREGFWLYTSSGRANQPTTVDNSYHPLKDDAHLAFIHEQCDIELTLHCFSPAFGPDLLLGMTTVPIRVVPKPHSDKLQLIIDPSTGLHSPNSLIPWAAVSVPLDNLHHLGAHLIAAKKGLDPSTHLIIFKSDVSGIYCHLPMHFLWQLFQVITINGMRHIDWNYNFGNWGAGGLWRSFIGLVLWITTYVWHLKDLLAYVGDVLLYELNGNLLWYSPYQKSFPAKQT